MNSIAGHCGKCGAPYTCPTIWHGVTPPPMTPSCACWNIPKTYTTTSTTTSVEITPKKKHKCVEIGGCKAWDCDK